MASANEDLLALEVRELTQLLRDDEGCADLRAALQGRGVDPQTSILAGLIEGEDEGQFGVLLTHDGRATVFDLPKAGDFVRWDTADDGVFLDPTFPAVETARSMLASGLIS